MTQHASAGPGVEADPFRELRMVEAFGCIRLRIPAIWPDEWDESAEMWCCCQDIDDPQQDTGTLWIAFNLYETAPPAPRDGDTGAATALGLAQRFSAGIAEMVRAANDDRALVYAEVTPDGSIVHITHDGEDKDGPLMFHRWDRALAIGNYLMLVHFSLVFTSATAERPAWRRLAETLDREVRAAEIGLPSDRSGHWTYRPSRPAAPGRS